MGRVYLGQDPAGRLVAIKVIRSDLALDGEYLRRFREEAVNAQRIARLHTAQVLDFNVEGQFPYLVTEFVEGPTLRSRIRDHGPIGGSELDQLAFVLAAAMQAMHAAALIHRDLKPENVILSSTGPRVIDFGVARTADAVRAPDKGWTVVGTYGYMAPEHIVGEAATEKVDIFAWGATVAFAGTGRQAFGEGDSQQRIFRTLNREPDLGGLELPLRAVVGRALHKKPAERPAAAELVRLLTGAGAPGDGPEGTISYSAGEVPTRTAREFEIEQEILRRMGL
jgi:serine/threonine protein kinase